MSWIFTLSFVLCWFIYSSFGQTLNSTTIPATVNGNFPIISAPEDTENVMMYCEVFQLSNGQQILTQWSLLRNSSNTVFLLFALEGNGQEFFENMMVTSTAEFRTNITILVFNSSFDNAEIGCGGGNEITSRFDLRIIKPPVLHADPTEQIVGEGKPFEFDIQETQGFPIVPQTVTWYLKESQVSEGRSNPNVSVYPFIRFTSVNRSDSGNYSILVTVEGQSANGFFILNVQYKPEGVAQSGPKYVLAGDESVTIIGFINIDGNPVPSSVWSRSGVSVIGARFNTSALRVLTISSVILNDAGNYTNTLNNTVDGVPLSIDNTIELVVAESPSMPRNVTILMVGAEYVNITWYNPVNLGTPILKQFRIGAVSSINEIVTTIDATNKVDSDHVNAYVVTGLKPSVEYSLNVSALSTVEQLGVLVSEPSETILFNTTLGAPSISRALLNNINGNFTVSWEFLHTGGSDLLTVSVQCTEEEEDEIAYSSAIILDCSATVYCLMDNISFGPVSAGINYSCLVRAENSVGRDEMNTNYILANTGIPSLPVIISVLGGAGFATITLRVDSFGVLVATDFTFIVSVFSPSDTSNPVAVRMITPDSVASHIVAIVVDDLSEGTYLFSAISRNLFSLPSFSPPLSSQVMVQQRPSTNTRLTIVAATSSLSSPGATPTMFTANCSCSSSFGIIGGIVIAFILLLVVTGQIFAVVLFIIYKTKVIKQVKDPLLNRELTALKQPSAEYIVYDQPDHAQAIDVGQNIAYGEVKSAK